MSKIKLCADCPTMTMMLASDWCGPCKRFGPTKDKLLALDDAYDSKHKIKMHFKVYEHGRDDEVHKAFGVKSYPTLIAYEPKTGKFTHYEGPRTTDDIKAYLAGVHKGDTIGPVKIWEQTPRLVNM